MLVLYLFLRNVWATVIISGSIPVSVIATFNLMPVSILRYLLIDRISQLVQTGIAMVESYYQCGRAAKSRY
ncbi:hypothetical protein [Alishewanella longhuensis]